MKKKQAVILGIDLNIKNSMFTPSEILFKQVGANTGNLAFHYAIDSHLGGDVARLNWGQSTAAFNASDYMAVIPCANQLGAKTDYGGLAEIFERDTLPMVAIGLGAQASVNNEIPTLTAGTLRWVRSIVGRAATNAPNISVRGDFSLKVLEKFGLSEHAVITGCPSLFLNPDPRLGKTISENFQFPKRIAVTAGHNLWTHLAHIEEALFDLVVETHGVYIAQSSLPMIRIARGEFDLLSKDDQESCRNYINANSSMKDFRKNINLHGNVFFNIPAWMEKYKHYDFVIGTRIHGVILALQVGKPAVCIVHDSRTLELCKTMMVPYVLANEVKKGLRPRDLVDMWDFDAIAFDRNRLLLAKNYLNFLENNNLKIDNSLVNFCDRMAKEISSLSTTHIKKEVIQTSNVTALDRYPVIFKTVTSILNENYQNPKVLSFGCSTGDEALTLDFIYLKNSEIIGLDINNQTIVKARSRPTSDKNKVSFYHNSEFDYNQKFDAIFVMSVLCKWPQAKDQLYLKDIFSYEDFSVQVRELDKQINVGGFLIIHNSNYYFEDTTIFALAYRVCAVELTDIGFVTRFDNKSKAYINNRSGNVIFQKIKDIN